MGGGVRALRARALPGLVRFATAMCADRALAEDLTQEVLVRVHARWSRISNLDMPDAYVRRALVNEYLSWRRKWARLIPQAVVPRDKVEPDPAEQHADRSELAAELAALPPRQRTVLVLRYLCGLSDQEIADIIGCRAVTVRGYAARGLATLRIQLGEPIGARNKE